MARSVVSPIVLPLSKKTFAATGRRPRYARPEILEAHATGREESEFEPVIPAPRYSPIAKPAPPKYSVANSDSGGRSASSPHCAGSRRFHRVARGILQSGLRPASSAAVDLSATGRSTARARLRRASFATHPGVRIAASEAALGGARPMLPPQAENRISSPQPAAPPRPQAKTRRAVRRARNLSRRRAMKLDRSGPK